MNCITHFLSMHWKISRSFRMDYEYLRPKKDVLCKTWMIILALIVSILSYELCFVSTMGFDNKWNCFYEMEKANCYVCYNDTKNPFQQLGNKNNSVKWISSIMNDYIIHIVKFYYSDLVRLLWSRRLFAWKCFGQSDSMRPHAPLDPSRSAVLAIY